MGAKPFTSGSPLASTSLTIEKMPPAAFSTPGTRRTVSSVEAGNAGGSRSSWVTGSRGVIATSVPFTASEKMSSKDLLIVSVRT